MSDDDIRERSPLHEAAPRDWFQHGGGGGGQGAAAGYGQGLGPQRIRKGIRNERDSTVRIFKKSCGILLNLYIYIYTKYYFSLAGLSIT